MQTAEEKKLYIDEQLQKDYKVFNEHPYEGFIPDGLMEKFRIALMVNVPGQRQYNPTYLKELIKKKEIDLSFIDLGLVTNLLFDTPFEKIFITLEDGLDYLELLLKTQLEYNKRGKEFEAKMTLKRNNLMKIYGLAGNTSGMNGKSHLSIN